MKVFRDIPSCPKPVGPYSPAAATNGLVFCAGQIALDPNTGQLVSGGIEEQTKQVLKNLKAVIDGTGSSVDRIVMTTVFLTNMADGKIVNELYGAFVNKELPPARQTVAVKELPLGALVEISLIVENRL